jgi:hypothetical protein
MIQKIFTTLTITIVIDLQLGINTWMHPSEQIWNNTGHRYEFMYKNAIRGINQMRHLVLE